MIVETVDGTASGLSGRLADHVVVLDGAMGSELDARGCDTNSALWSTSALLHHGDVVERVHLDYLRAGAEVIETNSYQANLAALTDAGFSPSAARQTIASSARLALSARDQFMRQNLEAAPATPLVAGSIGPYGAFLADGSEYTGAYRRTRAQLRDFHGPRLEILIGEGIDLFAVETFPRLDEAEAVLELLGELLPTAQAWLSVHAGFAMSGSGRLVLPDGAPLQEAAQLVEETRAAVAVGVNCVPPQVVLPALQVLASDTGKPLCAYPNSGEAYDPVTKTWSSTAAGSWVPAVPDWVESGARLVGSCCRSNPKTTQTIATALRG